MGRGDNLDVDSVRKVNLISFPNDTFQVKLLYKSIPFFAVSASICDSTGNLLCYTNGLNLYNNQHTVIPNGSGFQSASQFPFGFPFPQSYLILPYPDSLNYQLLIDQTYIDIITDGVMNSLRYSLINMTSLLGNVTAKKVVFSQPLDTFNLGHLTVVRHGNGRDWWILTTRYQTNTFRRYLVSDKGLQNMGEQNIGDLVPNGVGYSAFSPDGQWYASYNVYGYTSDPHAVIQYYRFDRCTGLLSESYSRYFPTPDTEGYGGVAFSPSSRFMYVSRLRTIYQYDLEAPDITDSEQVVAVTDSFKTATGKLTPFYGLQLAPDGRIYGNVYGSNTQYLHVIDQPDLPGPACNVLQHAIFLPAQNFGTLPNLPYYRLWEWKGSPCDTLGTVSQYTPPLVPPDIRVWPVPAVDYLCFSAEGAWPDALDLALYDPQGRVAGRWPGLRLMPYVTIQLDALPAGAYFYVLSREDGSVVKSGRVMRTGG